jgi:hypothetical protein
VLWKIIERAVNVVFLVLALVILTLFYNNFRENSITDTTLQQLELYKEHNQRIRETNVSYFEKRIGRLESALDSYQVSMSNRVDVISQKVKLLEVEKKAPRVVNNNINSAVVNGVPIPPGLSSSSEDLSGKEENNKD